MLYHSIKLKFFCMQSGGLLTCKSKYRILLHRENSISVFAISTYNTDYVMVKEEDFEKAMDILEQSGYKIVE